MARTLRGSALPRAGKTLSLLGVVACGTSSTTAEPDGGEGGIPVRTDASLDDASQTAFAGDGVACAITGTGDFLATILRPPPPRAASSLR